MVRESLGLLHCELVDFAALVLVVAAAAFVAVADAVPKIATFSALA